ncbi:methyl-accepting chemotaxis protein, partial [Aureimonas ureilytica]|uniref:methyl-accepting chemotaxis protein n=1 Tax=Aureimonas ureilytica TaxID=401562 RepID=UPI000A9992D6
SSRTEQQAAALQETAASMEQLTATVKSNSAGAQQTAESARETARLARSGETDMNRMSDTMNAIAISATKVRDITAVIDSIAFQTNILALNAAVEAARAGEQAVAVLLWWRAKSARWRSAALPQPAISKR